MTTPVSPNLDILPDGEEKGAAQLDTAPFPEKDNIPTTEEQHLEPSLKPDAFGDADSAAPYGVEDGTIEPSKGGDVPVDYVGAAVALGGDAGENEHNNTGIAEWHAANNTSAEQLTGGDQQVDPAVDPKSESTQRAAEPTKEDVEAAAPTSKLETPENTPADVPVEEAPKRTRRTKEQIAADKAAEGS